MNERKRERQRRKHAEALKRKARARAEHEQSEARRSESYDLADRAEDHRRRGEIADALRHAARAAAINPGDSEIARLYLNAAVEARDLPHEAEALELVSRSAVPDVQLFGRLAHVHLQTGDPQRAVVAARRARQLLPARSKDRRQWLALMDYVEMRAQEAEASPLVPVVDPGPSRSRPNGSAPSPPAPSPSVPSPSAPVPVSWLEIPIDIATDVDGLEVLSSVTFADLEEVELAMLAARIRDAESYQRLFSLERTQGLLSFSHQEETARKVLSVFLGRALLADEVGLGKTIEAGLVLSEYRLRGHVDSALVLTPPSLVCQWKEELASKFGIEARTTEDAAFRADPDRFWARSGIVIASLATARLPKQRDAVTGAPWDLLIVDEAHALKNAASSSYELVSRITSRFLLLLTATPVENRIEELYNLVSLLRPGHLGGRAAFLKRFSDEKVRASGATRAEVRELLSEVMVRNTRALSGVRLPPRFARTVLVAPDPAEAELYEHLSTALRAIGPSGRTRTLLSILLQEAGSSPFAVRATLVKLAENPQLAGEVIEALTPAIRCAERPVTTGKAAALLRVLQAAHDPAVVFTRFRPTLDFLSGLLTQAGIASEQIDGAMPAPKRHEAIERLRAGGGVLLSTEVGAEGLNLQFCRRIVNFDLPWNPARIEQRIGRVHRIGQDHPVDVINFCLAGSIEERILMILDERINLFELVIGEAEMILGYVEEDREFPDLVLDAFAERDTESRERSFTRIADALAGARARYDNVKRYDEAFFRNELGV